MASASNQVGPTSEEEAKKAYSDFMARVKRTIYLFNLSPQVTTAVIKSALGQVGTVKDVKFLDSLSIPFAEIPKSALVEMESLRKAQAVLEALMDFPFMMSGMPRPVSAHLARPEMFVDCPTPPERKKPIEFKLVKAGDRDYDNAKKLRAISRRQKSEHIALVKFKLEEDEKLAKQQQEMLMAHYKKYEIIEKIMKDGTCQNVAIKYGIHLDNP